MSSKIRRSVRLSVFATIAQAQKWESEADRRGIKLADFLRLAADRLANESKEDDR